MNRQLRWLFFGVVLLLLMISVFYQVNETQVVVLTQFGRPIAVVSQTGLHAKLPFPIQQTHKQDSRLLTFDPPAEEFLTLDKKNLIVDAFLLWNVKNPVKYLVSVGNRPGVVGLGLIQASRGQPGIAPAAVGEWDHRVFPDHVIPQ